MQKNIYIVFSYDNYYPSGGWSDMHSLHLDKDTAIKCAHEITLSGGQNVSVIRVNINDYEPESGSYAYGEVVYKCEQ